MSAQGILELGKVILLGVIALELMYAINIIIPLLKVISWSLGGS